MIKAHLVAQSHGAGGSTADYDLDGSYDDHYGAGKIRKIRVSVSWGTLRDMGVWVYALPSMRLLLFEPSWEAYDTLLDNSRFECDDFPLQNNPYLSPEYRRMQGWD